MRFDIREMTIEAIQNAFAEPVLFRAAYSFEQKMQGRVIPDIEE